VNSRPLGRSTVRRLVTLVAIVTIALSVSLASPRSARAGTGYTVLDSETWRDGSIMWIVMRVRNDSTSWWEHPYGGIDIYDAAGHRLTSILTGGWLGILAPGATTTFRTYVDNPAADHWAVTNIGGGETTPPRHPVGGVSAETLTPHDDMYGRVWPVRISNPNDVDIVGDVSLTVTAFDAQGHVLNVGQGDHTDLVVPAHGSIDTTATVTSHYAGAVSAVAQLSTGASSTTAPIYVTWDDYFGDVTLFRNDVVWLATQGITGGCAQNKFCPNAVVTRAQMAMFLVRAFDYPPAIGPDHFTDDNGKTGESSINALFEAGITGGCAPRRFCPGSSVTRAQMALFLDRALGLPPTSTDYFDDDDGITGEAAINRMAAAGITGGCGTRKFCPKGSVTRGQMAAFLHRALSN
jgi:hypothetical protein